MFIKIAFVFHVIFLVIGLKLDDGVLIGVGAFGIVAAIVTVVLESWPQKNVVN
ncbi:hypothetical protein ALQ65_200186 [Pseudomonas syringae pv. coriandricola]|uniref:Uncharacterized protein n=1 Tax=Pseudomonas syringae pv. coriandricola TaxID=264453 RepID=A0A3M3JPT7_9PSED|nr:hypothetical protein ALQ65_200186 [Pseudomonas syringae pv. coriandricola]